MDNGTPASFLARNEFLIRRLHSLSGLVPVGAYMVVHLLTNASVLDSPATYQRMVHQIHGLGRLLPVIEWGLIFIPILFHAILGVVIVKGGLANHGNYPYGSNYRYSLQRATGIIAFFFIMWHVFHMHGWFHFEAWKTHVAEPLYGSRFRPFNAASSLGEAMQGIVVPVLYAIGVLSCVYHLANGIWTMGITWGVWTTPSAQRRATWVCLTFGLALAAVGMSALIGATNIPLKEALLSEQKMLKAKINADEIREIDAKHKSWSVDELRDIKEKIVKQKKEKESDDGKTAISER